MASKASSLKKEVGDEIGADLVAAPGDRLAVGLELVLETGCRACARTLL
jgi:hypothetical protein